MCSWYDACDKCYVQHKIWPVLVCWNIADLTISQISAVFPYKCMYVIGKYLKFIGKKCFFSKCNWGMGVTQIAHGRKIVPYVTLLLCNTSWILLLPCNTATVDISPFYDHCCLLSYTFFSECRGLFAIFSWFLCPNWKLTSKWLYVTLIVKAAHFSTLKFHCPCQNYWHPCILKKV